VRFMGNMVLSLWDCGGQDRFMESYFESQREYIFTNVEVLIYVFDIESPEREKDINYFKSSLEALKSNSPSAKVFCLIHKMDVILTEEERLRVRVCVVLSLCLSLGVDF
jgi:Ras-related GTP-binding protein A/B